MEALIVLVILIVVALMLGVSGITIMMIIYLLAALLLMLMTVFFGIMTIVLLFSKRTKGQFERFEKESKFESAVYSCDCDGDVQEYRNIFPAETILRSQIYKAGERKLFLCRWKKKSFCIDMHSVLIIVSGIILSPLSCVLIIMQLGMFR